MSIEIKINTEEKVHDIIEEMKRVYKNDSRPWIIGYSGGKDSTVVVQLAFTMLESLPEEERHKDIYVVSSDTLIENPIVLGYLKESCLKINEGASTKGLRVHSHLVHPDFNNSFWANIIGKGLP
ncbi:MAG: DNA phosphorothioation system sulfurtransferase DndC, partial [Clostridium sp.]